MKLLKFTLIGFAVLSAVFLFLNVNYFLGFADYYISRSGSDINEDTPSTQAKYAPNRLVIPSLGIEAPIFYVDENSEEIFQAALSDGVVHYPGTAKPGEYGNVYIFGHSSDYAWTKGSYKNIFASLPNIREQAVILVTDGTGTAYKYQVTQKFVASPRDTYLLEQGNSEEKILTLQTSYPLGTAFKRFIVLAKIIE